MNLIAIRKNVPAGRKCVCTSATFKTNTRINDGIFFQFYSFRSDRYTYISAPNSEMSHKMEIPKWQGCLESKLMAPPAIVWKTVSDFYEVHKWFPGMKSCERVQGAPEKGVGSVRCCMTDLPTDEEGSGSYAVEELIAQDDVKHSFTFRITDTDRPIFQGYEGTIELCETGEHGNCLLKWSFQMKPIEGRSKDETEGIMKSMLAPVVSSLEKLASSQ